MRYEDDEIPLGSDNSYSGYAAVAADDVAAAMAADVPAAAAVAAADSDRDDSAEPAGNVAAMAAVLSEDDATDDVQWSENVYFADSQRRDGSGDEDVEDEAVDVHCGADAGAAA